MASDGTITQIKIMDENGQQKTYDINDTTARNTLNTIKWAGYNSSSSITWNDSYTTSSRSCSIYVLKKDTILLLGSISGNCYPKNYSYSSGGQGTTHTLLTIGNAAVKPEKSTLIPVVILSSGEIVRSSGRITYETSGALDFSAFYSFDGGQYIRFEGMFIPTYD